MRKFLPILIAGLIFIASSGKANAAYFYLEPQSGEVNREQEFEVVLKLDTTNEETSGTDVILNFSKEVLEVKSVSFNPIYALNDSQIDNPSGRLKIYSTMNSPTSSFKGNERLATIRLKSIKEGEGKVSFACQAGQTGQDTNIWKKGGGDIVDCGALKEGSYKVKSGCQVPQVPQNAKATTGPGAGQVTLSWEKVSGAKHYSINYGPSSLNYTWGADNVGDVSSYTVSKLEPGKPYYFIVMANNDCGSSGALYEVAAYAGSSQKQEVSYWQKPQIVYLPEEVTPPSQPAQPASPSPSPQASAKVEQTSEPEEEAKKTVSFSIPDWFKLSWLKWLGLGLILLIILSLIRKGLASQEAEVLPKKEEELTKSETPAEPETISPTGPEAQTEETAPPWLKENSRETSSEPETQKPEDTSS